MSEMVERVARVLCADENWREIVAPDKLPAYVDAHWRSCIPAARAAMEAMLTPTSQMLFEGVVAQDSEDPAVQRIYQAMLQAALKEPT